MTSKLVSKMVIQTEIGTTYMQINGAELRVEKSNSLWSTDFQPVFRPLDRD